MRILKNHTLRTMASSNFFATIGVSIFNIILLTYAKSFASAHLFVSIVSIASVIPAVFGGLTGTIADQTVKKNNWLINIKLVQAVLYVLLAFIINQQTVIVFYIVVFINIISDIFGRYGGNLLTIIIQNVINADDRQQVLGINTSISTVMEPIGQSIGIMIISQTHNYALAGVCNSITFIISAICLFVGRASIKTDIQVLPRTTKHVRVWNVIQKLMLEETGMSAVSYLGIIMVLNIVAISLNAILNLFFISLAPKWGIGYSVAILLVNIVYVFGSVLGGVTKNTWFDHLNLFQLLLVALIGPIFAYAAIPWFQNLILILLGMFIVAFTEGKLDPKIFATLMQKIDEHLTGSVFGTISTIVTVAAPIGSVGIILIYNLVGGTYACLTAIALLLGSLLWALLAHGARA